MTTLSDLINKAQRRLVGAQRSSRVQLASPYVANATTLNITDPSATSGNTGVTNIQAIRPGSLLAIDLEVMYVSNVVIGSSQSTATVTVIPGFEGSTSANHASGASVVIDPIFSQFDIMTAINDDLSDLSSPDNGLYQVQTLDITYNPAYMGYDLSTVPGDFLGVIELRYKLPSPSHNWPRIRRGKYSVLRNQTDSQFPSGTGLIVYESAYPGLPIHMTYKSDFGQFANLTDDATTVAGLSDTMMDIPPLGAMISLVAPREVKRNLTEAQPDPRKAPEVPAGAVMNSVSGIIRLRNARISAEAARLRRMYESQLQKGW